MRSGNLNKASMAQRIATSRFQLDRVLGPGNLSIQLDTRPASFRSFTTEVQGFALVVTLPASSNTEVCPSCNTRRMVETDAHPSAPLLWCAGSELSAQGCGDAAGTSGQVGHGADRSSHHRRWRAWGGAAVPCHLTHATHAQTCAAQARTSA